MRASIVLAMAALLAPSVSYADEGFTGFWKNNCEDAFGLQIMPAKAAGKYSVSFCGPGGCFEPSTYRPDTKLAGDPAYQIIDTSHIKVKGQDGWSDYTKCTIETAPKLQYKGCNQESAAATSKQRTEEAQCKD